MITKGQWRDGGKHSREIYDAHSGHTICKAPVADAWPDVVWDDNAQAISAVPDMIEALQNLISYLESNYDHNEIAMQECDKALLALEKAGIK
jgi:hypothetical protein